VKKIYYAIVITSFLLMGCGNKENVKKESTVVTKEPKVSNEEQFAFNDIKEDDERRVLSGSLWSNKNRISKYDK
jgi:uncharacterized protein YcfL